MAPKRAAEAADAEDAVETKKQHVDNTSEEVFCLISGRM